MGCDTCRLPITHFPIPCEAGRRGPQRQGSETVSEEWGMSVSRRLTTYRVSETQRLMLETPDRPLVDLMLDCGFQTRSNFNCAFKDFTGQTPSAWRAGHEKGPHLMERP
ncbi:helix-turn-helix domain-containing protein [Maricaulis maris]|uniref:helix-turn-helix domain-containing protein n=1 Tax=Maricaulis maris TaxID=74318 RepID=UPI003AF0ED7D